MRALSALLLGVVPASGMRYRASPIPPRSLSPVDSSTPELQACAARPDMQWALAANGTLSSASAGLCLSASGWPPSNGMALEMRPCSPTADPTQHWAVFAPPSNVSLRLGSAPTFCANVAGYGTTPSSQVWLYTCNENDCQGNCLWQQRAPPNGNEIVNPLSGLCLSDGDVPLVPQTCAPGSPSEGAPYCNASLPFPARVDALWDAMSPNERLWFFSIPIRPNDFNSALNLKSFYWDITGIAGLSPGNMNPQPNVTVFPGTPGQAATFDVELVARIGAATALEGRIVNQVNYRLTHGQTWQGVHMDGGPLANSAHDPRWGRISETYGEDPVLVGAMGIAATRALQQRQSEFAPGSAFLMTSQVTRHYMGTHGANDMPHDAEEYILPQWREEHQLRIYEQFQRPDLGDAEGVMCAISAFADAGDNPPPRNNATYKPWTPNCANDYLLQTKLRTEWNSSCFVQSDCCDSITAVVDHGYTDTLEEAVVAVMTSGLSASYGDPSGITAALNASLLDGTLDPAIFEARIKRNLLTTFRLGMYDTENPANPFRGPYNESDLDGASHRALAREAAARSMVLLKNAGGSALPLPQLTAATKLAVLGPFADCSVLAGGYGGHDSDATYPPACSYGHSYSGYMSAVSTYLSATQEEAAAAGGASVSYVSGSGIGVNVSGGVQAAAAAAAAADIVLLCVGLGTVFESEGNDRSSLLLPSPQAALADAVAAAVRPGALLVLVITSAGGVDFDVPRADAVVQAFYAGEEAGHGLWDLLSGRATPSARLPLTVFRDAYLSLVAPEINFNMVTFGTGRTYRYFVDNASSPLILHHFGYGLSYCTFAYSDLAVVPNATTGGLNIAVSVAAASGGSRSCREVTQVYLTLPAVAGLITPRYNLVAFASTQLEPAGAPPARLSLYVPPDALSTYAADGSRSQTGGVYALAVSGHLPDDEEGTRGASNVLFANVTLPPGQRKV